MKNGSSRAVLGLRTGVVGFLLAGTLVVSAGVEVAPSGAAIAAFCSAVFAYVKAEPTYLTDLESGKYTAYAKGTLPYFEKLDSASPSGKTKTVIDADVKILKYMASDKNLADLVKYLKLHQKTLTAASKSVGTAVKSCA